MARVRVQGQTGRSASSRPADCAVSPPPRLVDVVRGVFSAATKRMVHCTASPAAARRRGDAVAPGDESVPRPPATLSARTVLPVFVYHGGRAAPDGPLVEPPARRRICAGDYPRSLRPIADAATHADDHAH